MKRCNIFTLFTALGDEYQQRILLTFDAGGRLNVRQIVEVSKRSRSAVLHRLRILREAGAIESVKKSKKVYFWITKVF